jgi:hypothetical protein
MPAFASIERADFGGFGNRWRDLGPCWSGEDALLGTLSSTTPPGKRFGFPKEEPRLILKFVCASDSYKSFAAVTVL